jgi:hypothetical protein
LGLIGFLGCVRVEPSNGSTRTQNCRAFGDFSG